MSTRFVQADFNGLFGETLCLSHRSTAVGHDGEAVELERGLVLTAFEDDPEEDGTPGFLLASGLVEPAPAELQCPGSRWVLHIDARGIRRARVLADESA